MTVLIPLPVRATATAVCALCCALLPVRSAAAQDRVTNPVAPSRGSVATSARPAPSPAETPEITVTARRRVDAGTIRPTGAGSYALTPTDWSDVMTGTSTLAMAKNLPGVTFTSTDAFGLDLSDGFLLVRGFRQNELAITFEGIPLNDGSYGSVTGTAPLNIGVTGTIGAIAIAPGSAGVDAFSNTVDGGEMRYTLADPRARPDLALAQGFGSNATRVTSMVANSGTIGVNGPRLLFGIERITKNKYTGAGTQDMLRSNVKLVQDVPWGDLTVFASFSRARIWGYNNTSFDMLDKLGWNGTDILYPDYARAVFINTAANASLSCGAYTCGNLAALRPYDTGQFTQDLVGSVAQHIRFGGGWSGRVMAYGATSRSDIEISDITTPSQTGTPFSSLVWQTRPRRIGGTASLNYATGAHMLSAGLWVERTTATSRFASFNQPLPGQGAPLRAVGPYDVYGPAFRIANASRWVTQSLQFYVQDVFKPTDALTLTAGAKAVSFVTTGGGVGDDQAPNGRLKAASPFLPHLSAEWRPDARYSLYLDIARTMTGYRVSSRGNIGPVSSSWAADSQTLFDAALPTLKPESDWNFTAGAFRNFGVVDVNVDAYYGIVHNRLLNGTSGPQFDPVRSVGIVPRSDLLGADAIAKVRPTAWLDVSQSLSVSRLRYDSDLIVAGTAVPLKGHRQPGYPGVSLITQASAKRGRLDIGLTSAVYLDDPFTYSNDIRVPAYWQVNAHVGWRLPAAGARPELTFRLDANNLLDRHNIGSVGIGGYAVAGDYQTFMRSAPRQLLFTISTKIR